MKRSKVTAFFREFLFLGNLFNEDNVDTACVQRVDRQLMDKSPEERFTIGLFYDTCVWNQFMILDENGLKLVDVGIRAASKHWRWLFIEKVRFHETVGDAIARLGGVADKAHFVVYFEPIQHQLVLYKPPKGFTIQEWLEVELCREQAAIQAESQKIDALAQQK